MGMRTRPAAAQASEAAAVEKVAELLFRSDGRATVKAAHSQTTRTGANNAGRAARSRSGGGSGAAAHPHGPGQARQLRARPTARVSLSRRSSFSGQQRWLFSS